MPSGLSHAGVEWEPGDLHPYEVFHAATPSDVIGGAMLVYRGTFDLRRIQAVTYIVQSSYELQADPSAALRDARGGTRRCRTSTRTSAPAWLAASACRWAQTPSTGSLWLG